MSAAAPPSRTASDIPRPPASAGDATSMSLKRSSQASHSIIPTFLTLRFHRRFS